MSTVPSHRRVAFLRLSPLAVALLLPGIYAPKVFAVDGYWTQPGSGSWANVANWDSGNIADGADDTAYFGILANVPANTVVTLDGARAIGHLYFTGQSIADAWILNAGSGGPLTLSATLDTPSITVAPAGQQISINLPLAGTDGLEKLGVGTLVLTATNSFTGPTLVSEGTLRVNGWIGGDGVTVAAGSLGGTGVVSGPVVVQTGAELAPGSSLGALTISNSLTLQLGSATVIEVNAATLAHDTVLGLSNVNYGGTLTVSNLAGAPALGQTFPIFSAASSSGNFASLTPQPGAWLRWRFDPNLGVLSVVSAASPPRIASIATAGANVVLSAINGPPGATAYLLASTNVALAVTNWSRVATNLFDLNGNSNFTNAASPTVPAQFFLISVSVGP